MSPFLGRPAHLCRSRRSLSIVERTLLGISQNFPGFGDLPHWFNAQRNWFKKRKILDWFSDIDMKKKRKQRVGVTAIRYFPPPSLPKIDSTKRPVEIGVWPGVAPLQSCLAATYPDAPYERTASGGWMWRGETVGSLQIKEPKVPPKSKCSEIVSSTPKPFINFLDVYLGWWICRKGNHGTDSSWKISKSTQLLLTFVSFVPTPCEPTDERPLATEQWPRALWRWNLCQLPKSDSCHRKQQQKQDREKKPGQHWFPCRDPISKYTITHLV